MKKEKFEKLSPECQIKVAENFEGSGVVEGTDGTLDADESFRRDENGLEDMEETSPADGLTGGTGR